MEHKKVKRAPLNRTLVLSEGEIPLLQEKLLKPKNALSIPDVHNKLINGNLNNVLALLPDNFIDLLIIDPPYNLQKKFNSSQFKEMDEEEYSDWIDSWLSKMVRLLKSNASIYICCDWKSSNAVYKTASKYFTVKNRITWEREKGRGAKNNWKNCAEDIWFFTMGKEYTFNIDDVKIKRKVLAPYKNENGQPKDWHVDPEEAKGNFRITHPSNIWTDLTIPFWSMPENTDHPTQKPEKLLAKLILASSNPGDLVFDPFLGSGTTAVTAKKLNRNFAGIEIDEYYCRLAQKRLNLADINKSIQGYEEGIFWERNTLGERTKKKRGE